MEWKVTRFCEFSSQNGRAESPFILTCCDGSQVWGYPSWLICIHRVRQQKSLMSPVINGPAMRSGRVTGYTDRTRKSVLCPDWRPTGHNSVNER
jgi:hypothetical protein